MPGERLRLLAVIDGAGVGAQVRAVGQRGVQPLGEQRLVEAFVHARRVAERPDRIVRVAPPAATAPEVSLLVDRVQIPLWRGQHVRTRADQEGDRTR